MDDSCDTLVKTMKNEYSKFSLDYLQGVHVGEKDGEKVILHIFKKSSSDLLFQTLRFLMILPFAIG